MAFLTKEELKTVSDINIVDIITNLDDTIVTDIISESIDIMKGFLSRFYDIDAIFAATDGVECPEKGFSSGMEHSHTKTSVSHANITRESE